MTPPRSPSQVKFWWWVFLLVLGGYPLAAGMAGVTSDVSQPALPATAAGLLAACAAELGVFGALFVIAWVGPRPSSADLRLRWHGGLAPLWRGAIYSIALRIGVGIAVAILVLLWILFTGKNPGNHLQLRTELVVKPEALADPLYFLLVTTLVSFVLGGFREELWRSAMLAALKALAPQPLSTWTGQTTAVVGVAMIFGLGHLLQGWAGVAVTALLGIGLGMIILRHNSIWESVLAHGFFNATSFLLLYWMTFHRPPWLPPL